MERVDALAFVVEVPLGVHRTKSFREVLALEVLLLVVPCPRSQIHMLHHSHDVLGLLLKLGEIHRPLPLR